MADSDPNPTRRSPTHGLRLDETDGTRHKRYVTRLLDWYRRHRREVRWRGENDPYRIWVAEVMAQQTRLSVVEPYYERFVDRFPDVAALAAAPIDAVLKSWEGLGYYSRARNLHSAARRVVQDHGGRLPADVAGLRELPGIGPYTAGAIASLAYGRPEPAIDGNARRVLARLLDVACPTPRLLDDAARELISAGGGDAASLNQALMDLGGAVCTPQGPACDSCPLETACLARRRGTVHDRPARRSRAPSPHYDIAVGLVWRRGRLLIARRPESGLLGGLWEFPGGKIENGETPEDAARRELREELGIRVEVGELECRVRHAYSHFRVTLHAYHARHVAGEPRPRAATAWHWVEPPRLAEFAFPAANQRIIRRLREASSSGSASQPRRQLD